jgi:putative sensory transduction regulator
MRKRIALPLIASGLLALAPAPTEERGMSLQTLRGYLDRMGARYVAHPKSQSTLVVSSATGENADRVDLYVEMREDRTLVLTAYAKKNERYFSLARAADREKMFQRLLEENHRAFATFFVDHQGDVGLRFTFTTENGVGFESFRVAINELLRIADQYTPVLDEHMRKS